MTESAGDRQAARAAAQDLGPVVAVARTDPAFLAGRIALAGAERETGQRLGLDQARLDRLLLCRPPAVSRFAADVIEIAQLVGADPGQLAAVLREVDVVTALRATTVAFGYAGLLAAARDAGDAHVTPRDEEAERLRELAADVWGGAPPRVRDQRDVEAAITWAARLAVVTLSPLTLGGVREWLRDHGIAVTAEPDSQRVHGFLLAWRGVGVVFCDSALAAAERRVTLAHELGHFLLDYHEPRQRVLKNAPELLEVVDGVRAPTAADRAQALLARVTVGVHAHVRDGGIADSEDSPAAEDRVSRFALELLAPWSEMLELVRDVAASPVPYRQKLENAAGLVAARFALPSYAARSRARQAFQALGVHPGFFDRLAGIPGEGVHHDGRADSGGNRGFATRG